MPRLQILELPEGSGDDRPPFALVVDRCEGVSLDLVEAIESHWQRVGEQLGARGTLIFTETVDIPANDTTAYLSGSRPEFVVKLDGQDIDGAIDAAVQKVKDDPQPGAR